MEHSEFIYRIWDNELNGWSSRFDIRSRADAQWQIDYLASQGVDVSVLEIREQEIVWKTLSEVTVPVGEEER